MHEVALVDQQTFQTQGNRMSFPIYLLGSALVIGGVAWGLSIAGVSQKYIVVAAPLPDCDSRLVEQMHAFG